MDGAASVPTPVIRAVWLTTVLLVVIGLGAALGRAIHPTDMAALGEPYRQRALNSLGRHDPNPSERAAAVRRFDTRFAEHPLVTLLHVIPGGLLLALAPLQFSSRIRRRHLRFHRWSGRLLITIGAIVGITALYLGLLMPYAGRGESIIIATVGGAFLGALSRAVVAVRRQDIVRHREWMIRVFAIAIGISVDRVVALLLDVALTPAGLRSEDLFVLSIGTGWLITIAAAEAWIRYTRARPNPAAPVAPNLA